ncbi:MAG: helix-turn-helix domain-containing protein [Rhodospirillales bacterium]
MEPGPRDPVAIVDVVIVGDTVVSGASDRPLPARSRGKYRYLLILQLDGRSEVDHGSTRVSLRAHDLLLLNMRICGRISAVTRSRQLHVYFRDAPVWHRSSAQPTRAIAAICGNDALAVGLRCLILAMRGVLAHATPQEQLRLANALFDLAVAGAAHEIDDEAGRRPPGPGRLALLQESVENRLSDPRLCPAGIAAEHGISTRQLHRLFKESGTPFGAFVRRRRLERCRDDLADPRLRPLPMTEIAYRWGFSDSSHFSRCFRATFGCTARDFRAGRFIRERLDQEMAADNPPAYLARRSRG